MKILIGRKYETEFFSVFELVKTCPAFLGGGYSIIGDKNDFYAGGVIAVRDGANLYEYTPSILNARFSDETDEQSEEGIGFGIDGASWFSGLRDGVNAESADSQWTHFMEKVATVYHAAYSVVEYKQHSEELITAATAYEKIKKVLAILYPAVTIYPDGVVEITDKENLESEMLDIYGVSLRLALSGGAGQSERVLGKVYFSANNRKAGGSVAKELLPMHKFEVGKINEMLDGLKMTDDNAPPPDEALLGTLTNNALVALEQLVDGADSSRQFVDCLVYDENGSDAQVISRMLSQTRHNVSELQCSELKVLGISHIQWKTSVFDCFINGERKFRVIFGLNNSMTIRCLNCDAEGGEMVRENGIILLTERGDRQFMPIKDFSDSKLGFTAEELSVIERYSLSRLHMKTIECKNTGTGVPCKCLRCQSQLFSMDEENNESGAMPREYCRICRHPEVVYYDPISNKSYPTAGMKFTVNTLRMLNNTDKTLRKCKDCGRYMSVEDENSTLSLCPTCVKVKRILTNFDPALPEVAEAIELYKHYAGVVPVWKRMSVPFGRKFCVEDDGVVVFVVGEDRFTFDKLDIADSGFISSAVKSGDVASKN